MGGGTGQTPVRVKGKGFVAPDTKLSCRHCRKKKRGCTWKNEGEGNPVTTGRRGKRSK